MNSSSRRMLGAGAAGVAAALATAPLAHAAPAASPASQAAHGANSDGQAAKQAPAPRATTTAPVAPNYGFQKYRVGVQVKDGSYVPPGTTTAGTELTITETGPGIMSQSGKESVSTTCTTDASTAEGTATYCLVPQSQAAVASRLKGRYAPRLTVRPTPAGAPNTELFPALPGDTVTVTQTTVRPYLVTDPATATLPPCEVDPDFPAPVCGTGSIEGFAPLETDLVFDDAGVPPVAQDDTGTTGHGRSVAVHVTANDNTFGAPITGLSVVSGPKHGTATPLAGDAGAAGPTPTVSPSSSASQSGSGSGALSPGLRPDAAPSVTVVGTTIRYTPAAGFSGKDSFVYRLSDANGSATARVTVTVAAAPSSATSSASSSPSQTTDTTSATSIPNSASLSPSSTTRSLANTGTSSAKLGGFAALLLAVGGALTVLGRRRYAGRHAGTR